MSMSSDKIYPVLQTCLAQVGASHEWLVRRVLPLSLDQLRWRLRSMCWSITKCLDHLNRTFHYYLPDRRRIDEGSNMKYQKCAPAFEEPEKSFLRQMEPSILVAMSAPAVLWPASAFDPDQIVDQFPYLWRRFANAVQPLSGMAVMNVSIPDSIYPPVQSLGGVIALLAAHERRHLWQAQQVLSASDFPAYLGNRLAPDDCRGSRT